MVDVGRHMFDLPTLKQFLDMMALQKQNVLHLHLTDDQGWRIEIEKHPKLTALGSVRKESPVIGDRKRGDGTPYGGFLTQAQLRELVAYARALHIVLVPEIEMPGHAMGALVAYPELSCTGGPFEVRTKWGIETDVFCAGNDRVFALLEDVLAEVLDIFPSEFIHIGGDECPKDRWKACSKCQARIKAEGLKDEHELQSWFVRRIEKFLNARGRRLIGWDEILEGGLAPNAAVMSWRGVKGGIAAATEGHDVVMTPTTHCYLDYYQSRDKAAEPDAIGGFLPLQTVYGFDPLPAELPADKQRHILGVQGNLWSEYIATPGHLHYMAQPRLAAIAETGWTPAAKKDWTSFRARVEVHLRRLAAMDIPGRPLDPEPPAGGSTTNAAAAAK
jgi:hexosaminidase